ncbi:MAG TPA: molybdopterin synthase sulfur carrier subunit [Elusimicrobia bacterium]|nr:molybdopterin synthase sulfur carrier subunit [Elusimicrobiota bacterium]
MRYDVTAHANLRHYLPGALEKTQVESPSPLTVRELLERLRIPESEVMSASVGGTTRKLEDRLAEDCEVDLLPVLSGG